MTTPRRQTRAQAPQVPTVPTISGQPGGPIILPGSMDGFIASPEQQEQLEAEERRIVDERIRLLDQALESVWSCKACGTSGSALGSSLCDPCRSVAVQLNAQSHMGDVIGGVSRRELVEHFLSRQER